MAVDVLKHDDGVVDDKTDGQHEGEQRQRVDRKACRIHDGKGCYERDRDGDDGNDGRPEGMKEQQNDQNDKGCRLEDRREHIVDGAVDKDCGVKAYFNRSSLGQRLVDPRQHAVHRNGHIKGIGHCLLDDANRQGRLAIIAALAPHIRRAKFDPGHIAQRHLQAACRLERYFGEFPGCAKRCARQHGEFAVGALHAPCGDFGILRADRRFHILHGDAVSCELGGIEPDPHSIAPLAVH